MIVLDADGHEIVDKIINDTDNSPQASKKRKAFVTVVSDEDDEDVHSVPIHSKQGAAGANRRGAKEGSKPVSHLYELLSLELNDADMSIPKSDTRLHWHTPVAVRAPGKEPKLLWDSPEH